MWKGRPNELGMQRVLKRLAEGGILKQTQKDSL